MSTYRYLTTNILTGKVMFDNLPVTVSSFSMQLNGIGTLSGTLQLRNDVSAAIRADMIAALQPYVAVFWVFQDNIPIWAGPITGWQSTTMVGATMPFQASTMESMFQYRLISENIDFVNEDLSFVFRELANYGTSKAINSKIAGLNIVGPPLGFLISMSFQGSYLQSVFDAWNTMITNYDIEYYIQPAYVDRSNGAIALEMNLLMGGPLGRPYSATNLAFVYPSKQVLDYQWMVQNTNLANSVIATGTDNTSSATVYTSEYPSGQDLWELDIENYPLIEGTVTVQQPLTGGQTQINDYADIWVQSTSLHNQITPVIMMAPNNTYPKVSDVILGDECRFVATSPIHPAPSTGGPGVIYAGRITGWTVYPPTAGQAESVSFNLGSLTLVLPSG